MSLKFTKFTVQRNTSLCVDIGVTTYSVLKVYKVYNTKKHKLVGGRWPYKLIVSLKFKFKNYNTKKHKLAGGR